MSAWLLPLRERGPSAAIHLNFLWNDGYAYVMDNHRAALWCWGRHLPELAGTPGSVALLHIDRHTDALAPGRDLAALPGLELTTLDVTGLSLADYLAAGYEGKLLTRIPLFRWDNYLGLMLARRPELVHDLVLATHGRGERPGHPALYESPPWQLPLLDLTKGGPWIVNLDLDYLVFKAPDGRFRPMFGPEYLTALLAAVTRAREAGQVRCLTVCLSPECCGGWAAAEALARPVCEALGLDFALPEA